MYISDVKSEFYEYLIGKHIVIIVHYDIDALCTYRILQTLIKYDRIQYTLIPVRGVTELKAAYTENYEQVKCFVLINCGGTIDLVEEFDPPEDVLFFVLDSHRPTDVCNVYSNGQIRLLWTQEDDQNVPEFDDIFRDDEENQDEEGSQHVSDEEDDEEEGRVSKRRRLGEQDILQRRDRKQWESARDKLMFEYSQYSYYAKASAITLFDLAHVLAKDNREILWLAILALTEQMLLGKIESSQYTLLAGNLQLDVDRITKKVNSNDVVSSLKITTEQDLKMSLYRHWTVDNSLMYSLHTTCKLKLWSRRGERRLQELLAEMGLPLAQSKQKFCAMDLVYRQEFHNSLEKCGKNYGLDDMVYPSFTVQYNYRNKFSASDMVFVILALLEQAPRSRQPDVCFGDALDCLSKSCPPELINTGLDRAKVMFESCFKLMKSALDQRKIYSAGPFLYFIVHESFPDWYLFSHPHVLLILARYIQEGYCERYRTRNSASMPMLVSSPYSQEEESCILVGLPPLCENSPKNFFGKAFEQAAERTNATCSLDYFDSSYIQLRAADRTRFLDTLTSLLS